MDIHLTGAGARDGDTPLRARRLVRPMGPAPLERDGANTVSGDPLVCVAVLAA